MRSLRRRGEPPFSSSLIESTTYRKKTHSADRGAHLLLIIEKVNSAAYSAVKTPSSC